MNATAFVAALYHRIEQEVRAQAVLRESGKVALANLLSVVVRAAEWHQAGDEERAAFELRCGLPSALPPEERVCVVVLATDPADRVLLIRSRKRGGWELPGGKKTPGEPYRDAAEREFREETGLDCNLANGVYAVLDGVSVPGAAYASTIIILRARAEGQPTAGDDAADARWFAIGDIPWDDLSRIGSVEVVRQWARENVVESSVTFAAVDETVDIPPADLAQLRAIAASKDMCSDEVWPTAIRFRDDFATIGDEP